MAGRDSGSGSFTDDGGNLQLSPVAQYILLRVTDGHKVKVIASELGMTRDQVNWQVRRIYRYFQVKGVARLVHAAIRHGWIAHPKSAEAATSLKARRATLRRVPPKLYRTVVD